MHMLAFKIFSTSQSEYIRAFFKRLAWGQIKRTKPEDLSLQNFQDNTEQLNVNNQ